MKKLTLITVALLATLTLSGCGNSHNYHLNKLRAEHSKLLKESKKKDHKHKKKHSAKSKKSTKQSAAKKNLSANNQNKASSQNDQQNGSQQSSTVTGDANQSKHLDPQSQANVNKGLNWDGTRRRSSFSNDNDYRRYLAWEQGYNYNPNTGQTTRMNDQQVNDMRQQMSQNGGQNFQ